MKFRVYCTFSKTTMHNEENSLSSFARKISRMNAIILRICPMNKIRNAPPTCPKLGVFANFIECSFFENSIFSYHRSICIQQSVFIDLKNHPSAWDSGLNQFQNYIIEIGAQMKTDSSIKCEMILNYFFIRAINFRSINLIAMFQKSFSDDKNQF